MRALTPATEELLKPIRFHEQDVMEVAINKDATRFVLNLYSTSKFSDLRGLPSSRAANDFIKRIPERKELDGLCKWEVAATDLTAVLITQLWSKEQLRVEDDAQIVLDYLLMVCQQQEKNADNFSLFRLQQALHNRWNKAGLDPAMYHIAVGTGPAMHTHRKLAVHPEYPLALYQKVACSNSMGSPGYALLMEQGTGKTPVAIARICNEAPRIFKKEKRMMRVLIGCPKNVRMNWENEFHKFATTCGKVTVMRGGEIDRIKCMIDAMTQEEDCEYTVIIASYESIVRSWSRLSLIPWDLAILDEGHHIRTPEAKRTKCMMHLRDASTSRMLLTGSAICNTALDLYSQLEFLGEGFSGFRSWKAFKNFYGVYAVNEDGHKALVGMQNLAFMQERLTRLSFIVSKDEVLPDLPKKQYDIIEVSMTPAQEDAYKKLQTQLAYEIEEQLNTSDQPKQMVIQNVLTKLLRLAQVTSGFLVWDKQFDENDQALPQQIDRFDPNPKIEALVEVLKSKKPNEKTIIWACWVQDIKSIAARLREEGIKGVVYYGGTSDADREEAERAFNYDADCKWFLGNAAAGGTGLNLLGYPPGQGDDYATDADHTIYYSQNWSSVNRAQSEDRNHRRGTRKPVRVSDLCVPGTIDEEIRERVLNKRIHAATVADVRAIVRSVLQKVYSND